MPFRVPQMAHRPRCARTNRSNSANSSPYRCFRLCPRLRPYRLVSRSRSRSAAVGFRLQLRAPTQHRAGSSLVTDRRAKYRSTCRSGKRTARPTWTAPSDFLCL